MSKKSKRKAKLWWKTYEPYFRYIVVGLPLLIYINSLFNQFAVDDTIVILDNEFTKQGIQGISNILSEDTFLGFFRDESKSRMVSGGRYRPLSLVLFAIEYQIVGENPFLYHLTNIVLYTVLCWLIFLSIPLLLKGSVSVKYRLLISFLITLIFAAHPVHTEVVANIKGRDEIMALLFCLWAFYLQERSHFKSVILRSVGVGLVYLLGLLSKENAITFILVIPLIYYQLHKIPLKQALKRSIPFFAAAAVFLIIRSMVIGNDVSGVSAELMNNPFLRWDGSQYVPFSISEKMALITHSFFQYIRLFLVPFPITHDYYPRHIDATSFTNIGSILGLVLGTGMAIYAFINFRSKPIFSFGLLFFGITISLVVNILFPIGTIMSERFLFMPSLGLSLILGYVLHLGLLHPKWKSIIPWIFGILIAIWSTKTVIRNYDWKNNYTLFSKDIRISKNSAKLNNALGGEIIAQALKSGDDQINEQEFRRAVTHLNKAVDIHPTYKNAHLLLGNAHYHLDEFETAIRHYRRALAIDANYPDALNNLAITLREAGKQSGEERGDLQMAITYLKESEQLNSEDYETLRLLGVAYGMSQNHDNAVKYFTLALNIRPEDAQANFNLGLAYLNAGNAVQAEQYIKKAESLNPNIGQQNAN